MPLRRQAEKPMIPPVNKLAIGVLILAFVQSFAPFQTIAQNGYDYAGIVHVSWWFDEYTYPAATLSRDALAATGANWASLLVTWYQDTANSTLIAPRNDKTPTDDALRIAIQELHGRGLKVMVKPHVDPWNGQWRGEINPANPDSWFNSYTHFILHFAQLAQEQQVEAFCMGTELKTISGAANRERWIAVIDAIRAIYRGPLTYAANATSPADEFTSVSFWDHLDLLGLDGYFPLTDRNEVTLADLISAWRNNRYGEDLVATVQNFSNSRMKPVIFTELGYRSVDGTNREPWNFSLPGGFDPAEQRDCYEAALSVWSGQTSWMKGFFWWAWPVPAPGANDTDYNPRGKPAEGVLKRWFITVPARNGAAASYFLEAHERYAEEKNRAVSRQSAKTLVSSLQLETAPFRANRPFIQTSLMEAVKRDRAGIVRQLLSIGADVNAVSSGKTPLIEAAEQGGTEIARLLIQAGASLNTSLRGWGTALETAERTGHSELAALLRQSGAHSSGKSAGDKVCVRPWQGNGYCGIVEEVQKTSYRICVTEVIGCLEGCVSIVACSEGRLVGGPEGIQIGDIVTVESSCLTHTGVSP